MTGSYFKYIRTLSNEEPYHHCEDAGRIFLRSERGPRGRCCLKRLAMAPSPRTVIAQGWEQGMCLCSLVCWGVDEAVSDISAVNGDKRAFSISGSR